jgi:hypothetical protein
VDDLTTRSSSGALIRRLLGLNSRHQRGAGDTERTMGGRVARLPHLRQAKFENLGNFFELKLVLVTLKSEF